MAKEKTQDQPVVSQRYSAQESGNEIRELLYGQGLARKESEEELPDSVASDSVTDEEVESEDEDVSDVPNGKVRLEKFKKQRDEARDKASALSKQLDELSSRLSKIEGGAQKQAPDSEDSGTDPTEFMTDTELLLYKEIKALKLQNEDLMKFGNEFSKEKKSEQVNKKESVFFENHPELREHEDEVREDIVEYLLQNPKRYNELEAGDLSMEEVWALTDVNKSKPSTKPYKTTQNPERLSSGGRREGVSPPASKESQLSYEDCISEYRRTGDKKFKKAAEQMAGSEIRALMGR